MYAARVVFPESLAKDPSDVVDALDIGRALWERGETQDAIRWVRRAVEAADGAGDTARVAALARSAAELVDLAAWYAASSASSPRPSSVPPAPCSTTRISSRGSPAVAGAAPVRSTTPPPRPVAKPASLPATARRPPPAVPRAAKPSAPARTRVAVQCSVREATFFVVRPLSEGEPLPRGTREAFLVMEEEEHATELTELDAQWTAS